MRKIIAIVCAVMMTVSCLALTTSAAANRINGAPDWLITEINANPVVTYPDGHAKAGTSAGDLYEFVEIYNNSGKALNLYDFCITYNGTNASGTGFERAITEITPLAVEWKDNGEATYDITEKMPGKNPEDSAGSGKYTIAAGEVVLIWFFSKDCYAEDAVEMVSLDDFRTFYGLAATDKVVVLDANTSANRNFNVKNSDTGTYGIAKYKENKANLDAISNTKDAGTNNTPYGYYESDVMVTWATLAFRVLNDSKAVTYNGNANLCNAAGETLTAAPDDGTTAYFRYAPASGKRMYCAGYAAMTPGKLNDTQKADLASGGYKGVAIKDAAGFKKALADNPNGVYYLTKNIDFGGEVFKNYMAEDFSGILDGRGFALFNYEVKTEDAYAGDAGTFRCVGLNGTAIFKDLFFGKPGQNVKFTVKSNGNNSYGVVAGATVGTALSVRFDNVHIYADANIDSNKLKGNFGGFIGYARKIEFVDCSFNGSATGGNAEQEVYFNVAGFAASVNVDRTYLLNCVNTAAITALHSKSESRAAGFITYCSKVLTLVNCRNEGKVVAGLATDDAATYDNQAAGIIATANGETLLDKCINAAVVECNDICGALIARLGTKKITVNAGGNYAAVTGKFNGAAADALVAMTPADAATLVKTEVANKPTEAAPKRDALPVPAVDPVLPPTGDSAVYYVLAAVAMLALAGVALNAKKKSFNV